MKTLLIFALIVSTLVGSLHAKVTGPDLLKQQWGELEDLKSQLGALKRHHSYDKIGIHIAVGSTAAGMVAGLTNIFRTEKTYTNKMSTTLVFGGTVSSLLSDKYLSFDYHQLGKLITELNKFQSKLYSSLPRKDRLENTVHWRPTYKAYVAGCKNPNSGFRSDLYIKVYTDSLQESMGTVLLNPKSISKSIGTKGISSSLDYLLYDDAFINAMNDCQSESKHHAFVAKLLLVDSIGKIGGIAIAGTIYTGGALLMKGVLGSVTFFSPVWGARAKYAAMAVGVGGYIKWVHGQYSGQSQVDKRATQNDPAVQAEVARIKSELFDEANREIEEIDGMLASSNLNQQDTKDLKELRKKWIDIKLAYR